MSPTERLALFTRDLQAIKDSTDGMLIFNVVGDEDTYVQFSHRAGEPLYCEVSNRSEGWNTHSLKSPQVQQLQALGYEIPPPIHQANPNKDSFASAEELATEVEQIFRSVFGLDESYDIESSGVFNQTFIAP